ncbi:hypothetical protein C8Q76DRAFT_42599 [Earliella scabrosa]|nr:hypothetical protein C8Q76DRAFT_42599 [Earliella scabrosa]
MHPELSYDTQRRPEGCAIERDDERGLHRISVSGRSPRAFELRTHPLHLSQRARGDFLRRSGGAHVHLDAPREPWWARSRHADPRTTRDRSTDRRARADRHGRAHNHLPIPSGPPLSPGPCPPQRSPRNSLSGSPSQGTRTLLAPPTLPSPLPLACPFRPRATRGCIRPSGAVSLYRGLRNRSPAICQGLRGQWARACAEIGRNAGLLPWELLWKLRTRVMHTQARVLKTQFCSERRTAALRPTEPPFVIVTWAAGGWTSTACTLAAHGARHGCFAEDLTLFDRGTGVKRLLSAR